MAVPSAQQQPAPTPKAEPAHNVYVLTGCLAAGVDTAATFKLTDASSIGQAAPGGKATFIAQRMRNAGRVIASDISEERLQSVQRNCAR